MSKTGHTIFIAVLTAVVILTLTVLIYTGFSYYNTNLEERFFHISHSTLKPSGILGHGLGIIGSFLILIGVFSYMIRKRNRSLMRLGLLKHWLEFHIFLCTLGPIMILFHTAFKFGGLVAISFWSMVAVFLSGIIGRFIYIQIPRSIEGRELSISEVRDMKSDVGDIIKPVNFFNLKEMREHTIPTTALAWDGMAVSKKGVIIAAGWGGVWFISPKGVLLAHIQTPDFTSNTAIDDKEEYLYWTAGKFPFTKGSSVLYRYKLK